jgi:hypothetical protein
MKLWLVFLSALMVSCVSTPQGLTVKQYHLRENMFDHDDDPMVRGEVQRRLHGAVTVDERRDKIGHYYHVTWNAENSADSVDEIVFEYMQSASGSKIKKAVHKNPGGGSCEAHFAITAHDYQRNGRVLAWLTTARRDGKVIATKRSYMWR